MSELDLLRAFFRAYEQLEAIPKKKGAPSMEVKAARDELERCAAAVRTGKSDQPVALLNPDVLAFRNLSQQIAQIPPAKGQRPQDAVVISKGPQVQNPEVQKV